MQHTANFLDQSALDFRIEQKEEPPGNHHDRGWGVHTINFEPALDQNLRNRYAGPASDQTQEVHGPEVERLRVPINRVDVRRGLTLGDLAQH